MQFPTLTIVFLFFGVILATPINLGRLDSSEITKRSSHDGRSTNTSLVQEYSAGGSISNSPSGIKQDIRKRNGWPREELIEVLGGLITPESPARIERSGLVYNLSRHFRDKATAVKIIYLDGKYRKAEGERKVRDEARRLYDVQQLWGWGRTEDGHYHYFVVPFLGQPWDHVDPPPTKTKALQLMQLAQGLYHDIYHVSHSATSLDQCVFIYLPQEKSWMANLVDWSPGTSRVAKGAKKGKSPEDPFIIHSGDNVYRPDPKEFERLGCEKM